MPLFLVPLLLLNVRCQTMPAIKPVEHVKEYMVPTADGWDIAVSRLYREKYISAAGKKRIPVLLCHTLRVNDFIWELGAGKSLAAYLANNGYDVWMFSFRGSGKSREAAPRSGAAPRPDISTDDLIREDLAAVVNLVVKETNSEKVILVGHGLGAAVCAVYAGRDSGNRVASLVAIAPMLVNFYKSGIMQKVGGADCPLSTPDNRTFRLIAGDIVRTDRYVPSDDASFETLFFNRNNMESAQVFGLYSFAVDVTPKGLIAAYRELIDTGVLPSETMDYLNEAKKIRCPTLVISGLADNAAPPETARHFYKTLTAVEKELVECCRANGYKCDYGHLDLVAGAGAPQEVYPSILKWIKKTDGAVKGASAKVQ